MTGLAARHVPAPRLPSVEVDLTNDESNICEARILTRITLILQLNRTAIGSSILVLNKMPVFNVGPGAT